MQSSVMPMELRSLVFAGKFVSQTPFKIKQSKAPRLTTLLPRSKLKLKTLRILS